VSFIIIFGTLSFFIDNFIHKIIAAQLIQRQNKHKIQKNDIARDIKVKKRNYIKRSEEQNNFEKKEHNQD